MLWRILLGLSLVMTPLAAQADSDEVSALIEEGVQAQLRGEYLKARGTLNEALAEDKNQPRAHVVLAMVLLELGDGPGARMHLERALALKHPKADTLHLLAHAAYLEGREKVALDLLTPGKIPPRYAGYAARVRGLMQDRLGNADAAGSAYDEAVQRDPKVRGLWADVAEFRWRAGDLAGAIDAAVTEVRQAPRSRRAIMLVGSLVRDRYGLVAALPWFRRAVALEPSNMNALGELAATLGDAGRTVEMLRVTRKMIEIDPSNARAFYLQAVMAARGGKPDLARALLYRTQGKMDEVPAMILLNAVLDLQAGSSEQAISRLEKLLDMQPDNLKARRLLGAAMWRAGDTSGTVEALKRVASRGDADSYTLSIIGRAYEQQGERAEAAHFLDRAANADGSAAPVFDISGDLMRLARASTGPSDNADQAVPWIAKAVQDGRTEEALAHAKRLAQLNPGAPAAQILEGDTFAAMGRHAEAVIAYRRAADLRFNEPVALRLVESLLAMGNAAEALRVLDYFLSQNPRSVPGLLLAADHFMSTGRWDQAIAILTGLRERLGNRDAAVLSNLGWAWFNKGNPDKAVFFAGEAYELLPANPTFASAYGWILYKSKKNPQMGIDLMRKSVATDPLHPELRMRLGQALAATGDKAGAREHLTRAASVSDYPNAAKARELLKTV